MWLSGMGIKVGKMVELCFNVFWMIETEWLSEVNYALARTTGK